MTMLLKEDAVSEVLKVSVSTLRRWRSQGNGPLFRKLNGVVRYNPEDLKQFADERTRTSTGRREDVRSHGSRATGA